MRKPSLRIPFRGMGGRYANRLAILRSALVCKPEVLYRLAVPRSDGKAKLSDSISRYRRPFMQTDGLICVLHAKNRKCYGG